MSPTRPSTSASPPFFDEMSQALSDADKLSRMGKVEELKSRIKEESFNEEELSAWGPTLPPL